MTNSTRTQATPTVADMLATETPDRVAIATAIMALSDDDAGAAYVAADRSGRATLRAALTDAAMRAAGSGDLATAQAALAYVGTPDTPGTFQRAASAASGSTATPTDWQALVTQRATDLFSAAYALLAGDVRPQGMPDDAAFTPLDSDAMATLRQAAMDTLTDGGQAIAAQRVSRGGVTRDVNAFLAEYVPAAIQAGRDDENGHVRHSIVRGMADDAPSAGSVGQAWQAVVNGTRTVPGVQAVTDSRGGQAWAIA